MISKEANNQLTRWIRSVSRQRAGYPPSSVHWSLERHHLDPPRISMGDLQDPNLEVPTIYKAYFLGNIPTKYDLIWYSTSISGS